MALRKEDIVGHKLARIVQRYELLDGWIDFTDNIYILDSGAAFHFPALPDGDFTLTDIPADAEDIAHPHLKEAIGSTIDRIYRPCDDDEVFCEHSALLHLESGFWLWHESCAPHGTGSAGVYINQNAPYEMHEMVDFWSNREEP